MDLQNYITKAKNYLKDFRSLKNSELLGLLDEDLSLFQKVRRELTNEDSLLHDDLGFYFPVGWPLPYEWPVAIDSAFISEDTETDKRMRASGILEMLPDEWRDGKFLDFGCGEGHLASQAATVTKSYGYDIKKTWVDNENCSINWKEIKSNGPYDFILMFDVFDHIEGDLNNTIARLKDVLSPDGLIWARCHPWSSRHGGHVYNVSNKAYAHLAFSQEDLIKYGAESDCVLKEHDPLSFYWQKFKDFNVSKETITLQSLENYFLQPSVYNRITDFWSEKKYIKGRSSPPFSCGKTLTDSYGCFRKSQPTSVGSTQPNNFGLFDFHGNVWEWCEDVHKPYTCFDCVSHDPLVTSSEIGANYVIRGGGCWDLADDCRSACRKHSMMSGARNPDLGFRVAMEANGREDAKTVLDGVVLVRIPAGVFMMGSPASETGRYPEYEQQHAVRITKPFYMSAHPITQQQFQSTMGHNNSEHKGDRLPVTNVNLDDAHAFCKSFSSKHGVSVRLPTEAEWEYSCRGQGLNNCVEDILSIQFVDFILR